jgi:hypothetical protein
MPHMLHVFSTLESVVDSLEIMPKDAESSIRSSFYPRRILDTCSKASVGFFVLIQDGLNVYVQMLHHDQVTV